MNNKSKRSIYILFLLMILIIGISYAWLTITLTGEKSNNVTVGTLSLKLDEEASDGIEIKNAVPKSDFAGLGTNGYKFELINNGNIPSEFIIYLNNQELSGDKKRLADDSIKYVLIKNKVESEPSLLSTININQNRILDKGRLDVGEKNTYELKLWLDSNTTEDVMGKVFLAKLMVKATQEGIE